VNYFFDNNLPPRLAHAINTLMGNDGTVIHLQDKFKPDTSDIEWITQLSSEGRWNIITLDNNIINKPHERKAWQQAKLTTFFLKKAWCSQDFWLQAFRLIQWWPDIVEQANKVEPGAGFRVPLKHTGRFEQMR